MGADADAEADGKIAEPNGDAVAQSPQENTLRHNDSFSLQLSRPHMSAVNAIIRRRLTEVKRECKIKMIPSVRRETMELKIKHFPS